MRLPLRTRLLILLSVIMAGIVFGPFQTQQAGAMEINVPYDWYRYQGESDSGPDALQNCEVTTTTMAIQLVRGGLRVPIKDVRAVIGHSGPTSSVDAKKALRYWGVPTNDIDNMSQVLEALKRGHPVIVGLMMSEISAGQDINTGRSPVKMRTGRYSSYTGAHSIIVRGVSADGQYLTVYDPNHWDGNPIYLYADGTPKGRDRLYKTSEVAAGMKALLDFPRAIEILVSNAKLTNYSTIAATPTPTKVAGVPAPSGKPAPRQSGDLTALVSGGGTWSSAVVSFGVRNDGDGAITFDAIGIRGVKPDGKAFEQLQRGVTLGAGEEKLISFILETPAIGEWQIKALVYQANGAWVDLPADNHINKAGFTIGQKSATAPGTAPVAPSTGKKPSGNVLAGQ